MQLFERKPVKSRFGPLANLLGSGVITALLFLSQACGGSSDTPSLQAIQIKPAASLVPLAGTRQLKATGVYSDGSTLPLTTSVTWSSSSAPSTTNYVSVNSIGLATGMALGTSTISASLNGVLGVTSLTASTNGFQSSATAILFVSFKGKEVDAVYLPQSQTLNTQGVYTVQEVNLDADQLAPLPVTSALIASIPMPPGYVPSATAASQTSSETVVISYTSPDVQVIDASNLASDPNNNKIINTFTAPVTQSVNFKGITCMICGIVVNPSNDQAILNTAQGYYTMDLTTGQFTALPVSSKIFPAESFYLNPVNPAYSYILNPTFGYDPNFPGEVQLINLANNTVTTNTALGIAAPAAVALDFINNGGIIIDENSNNQVLVDLNTISTTATTWTTAQPPFPIDITSGCSAPPAALTMVAFGPGVGSQANNPTILFGQPSGNCVAVEQFQGAGVPTALGQISYGYGAMPPTPDGIEFTNGSDPNMITTFTSVYDNRTY